MADWRYYGPDLPALFDPSPADKAARRMTDTAGDLLHHIAVQYTPVKTGNLRSAWYRDRTSHEMWGTNLAYVSRVKNDVEYAPYVNYGTGLWGPQHRKYLIEPHPPNTHLSWIDPLTGRRVFAKRVWHPGSEGAHMIENATHEVGAFANRTLEPDLQIFKRDMEAQIMLKQASTVIPKSSPKPRTSGGGVILP